MFGHCGEGHRDHERGEFRQRHWRGEFGGRWEGFEHGFGGGRERFFEGGHLQLVILQLIAEKPSYGYDLKRDYDAYFGRGKPLRYSQVYATLSRLARDGKAIPGPIEQEAGPERRRYVITETGIADVERWLAEPAPPEPDLHSELFAKVVPGLILGRRSNVQGISVGSTEMFEAMNAAIAANAIKPVIDKVFGFDDAPAAYQHMASGAHFGKIVIRVA